MLSHVPNIEMDETTKEPGIGTSFFLRAMWYFQVNLLWDKGTMPLEPKDANYIPEDASEQEYGIKGERLAVCYGLSS